MFTGIIETCGQVINIDKSGSNLGLTIKSTISSELKINQSVAHNGICLTVTEKEADIHQVTAVGETVNKTNLSELRVNDEINLERCLIANGRLDGHIVQGHVDQTAVCSKMEKLDGSWLFEFVYDRRAGSVTVEKGSITINGVSLTCFNAEDAKFTVTVIPYTMEHTNFKSIREGDIVNLEFDIIGKYVAKLLHGVSALSVDSPSPPLP